MKKHLTFGGFIWNVIQYASLLFFGFLALLPIASCVITAFKTEEEYRTAYDYVARFIGTAGT